MKNFTPKWLCVKKHNITGLKYFLKTITPDVRFKNSFVWHGKSQENWVVNKRVESFINLSRRGGRIL